MLKWSSWLVYPWVRAHVQGRMRSAAEEEPVQRSGGRKVPTENSKEKRLGRGKATEEHKQDFVHRLAGVPTIGWEDRAF